MGATSRNPQSPPNTHPPPTAFQSPITRFTGRFSAFRLAAKANSRTSPHNVEAQSPADQSENRMPQNRMRGDLYAKSFRVSLAVLRSCLHDPREFQSSPTLDLIPWRHERHHLPPSNAWWRCHKLCHFVSLTVSLLNVTKEKPAICVLAGF